MPKSKELMPLSDLIFLEKWAHARFGGRGDFRNDTKKVFIKLGIPEQNAWTLTNRVRRYGSAYAHFFDFNNVDNKDNPNPIYPIENLLTPLIYKFAFEFTFDDTDKNITPLHRSQTFKTAKGQLRDRVRYLINSHTWGDIGLEEMRKTWHPSQFPENFERFRGMLFTKIDKAVTAAIETEISAINYLNLSSREKRKIKISRDTRAYINAVGALREELREEIGSET